MPSIFFCFLNMKCHLCMSKEQASKQVLSSMQMSLSYIRLFKNVCVCFCSSSLWFFTLFFLLNSKSRQFVRPIVVIVCYVFVSCHCRFFVLLLGKIHLKKGNFSAGDDCFCFYLFIYYWQRPSVTSHMRHFFHVSQIQRQLLHVTTGKDRS